MKDAILPQIDSFIDVNTKTELMPSEDWQLDVAAKRVRSTKLDGADAVAQACYMILSTEMETWDIYPNVYGRQIDGLFGMPTDYAKAVLPKRITDALMRDARIGDVYGFQTGNKGGHVAVRFMVQLSDEAKEAFGMEVVM